VAGLEPDWAPDSTRLVYGALGDLWVMARNGSEKRRLTSTSAFELEPAWSQDGTRIAYLRDEAVWTMQADGTGQSRVGSGSEPAWGPQGLAYVRGGRVVSGGRKLTPARLIATGPAFSRDGTKLAFAGDVTDCEQPGLFVADAGGSHLKRLTGRDCRIFGTARADSIVGTPRRDIIDARAGRDHVRAGAGADDVHARDGARDTIACGPGADTVFADRLDVVARDCEDVRRP
jgi:Tol biopolymer transport system component